MTPPSNSSPIAARTAVAYVRRSTNRQEQSIGDQRTAIENYAALHQFEIVSVYADDAVSGTSIDGRAAFKRMLSDARSNSRPWTHILVFDISRFSRGDIDEAGHIRHELRSVGVEVVYINENLTGTDSDDLLVAMKQYLSQRYVKDLSKVTIRGQVSHSESGAWCGGTPPFGYDLMYHTSAGVPFQRVRWLESGVKEVYDPAGKLIRVLPRGERISSSKQEYARLVPSLPERVAIIGRVFHEYAELGRGVRSIAERLNADRIPSPRNGAWSANTHGSWSQGTVRSIVRNRVYRGDLYWNRRATGRFSRVGGGIAVERPRIDADRPRENDAADWIVVRGTHEPLVPPSLVDRAQELMTARKNRAGGPSFRVGSGLRSPFLLSGLLTCGRCGQRYQGRTVNSTKYRKDGTKIRSFFYICSTTVTKGSTCCKKFLLRQQPLEELLLDTIRGRLDTLLAGEGETLLRQFIDEEIAAQGADPRREMRQVRERLAEIDQKASVLLENMSADTKAFIDSKLRDLATEKRGLQSRLETLDAAPYNAIDADAVLRDGLASLANLPRLMDSASLEERKEFVHVFIGGVTVVPDEARLDIQVRQIPLLCNGNSSVDVVAGARYVPLQVKLQPEKRYVVASGARRLAA